MFTFKGISTKEMNIIVEEPDNLIAKAPQKYEVVSVLGKSDSSYYPMGYDPISISLSLQLLDPGKVDKVLGWLDGQGELVYKERKTQARIFSEVRPIRTSGIRLIDIEIIRAPFWYDLEEDYSEAWGANLIPNGWDSFEPYGSGISLFKQWNFDKVTELDDTEWNGVYSKAELSNDVLKTTYTGSPNVLSRFFPQNQRIEPDIHYILRVKMRNLYWDVHMFSGSLRWINADLVGYRIPKSNDFTIHEIEVVGTNDQNRVHFYFDHARFPQEVNIGEYFEIAWLSLTPVDNQHLVVEKTPLENGLTRIQTWGGKSIIKLSRNYIDLDNIGEKRTISMYVDNLGDWFELRGHDRSIASLNIDKGYIGFGKHTYTLNENVKGHSYVMTNAKNNLDFIASTPTIVEGDTPPTWEADENPRIVNEGTAPSKPLIKLTKGTSSTCEFEVNGVYFKYHFNNDDHVIIDCEEMEATYNGLPRNRHLTIGFEFPVLKPGDNVVKQISGDAKIEFKRKDRWL